MMEPQSPQRVHIVDMHASLRAMAAEDASDDRQQQQQPPLAASTATFASGSDGGGEGPGSVAALRGWLDEFGRKQKEHVRKYNPRAEEEAAAAAAAEAASPPPMPPSQVRQTGGRWKGRRASVGAATRPRPAAAAAPRMVVVQVATPPKIPAEEVQATNDGYASVKQLSAWLAQDPTRRPRAVTRKQLLKGPNVAEKSQVFVAATTTNAAPAKTPKPTSTHRAQQSLCMTLPVKRVGLSEKARTIDEGDRQPWESATSDASASQATSPMPNQCASTRGVFASASSPGSQSWDTASWTGETCHDNQEDDTAQLEGDMAAMTLTTTAVSTPDKLKGYGRPVAQSMTPPFMSPSLKVPKKRTTNMAPATVRQPTDDDAGSLVDSDVVEANLGLLSPAIVVPRRSARLRQSSSDFVKLCDGERTIKTCSLSAEEQSEASIDPPIIRTNSTLTSVPDADASYQLTENESQNGKVKLDVITPAPSRRRHPIATGIMGALSNVAPELPREKLDIASLRSTLKPRCEKENKADVDDDMGPVGFHAARATFLARINPPPRTEPEAEEDLEADLENLEQPIDFRKARALLVKRSKKNGNDVEVLNKVTRRKAKFERLGRENSISVVGRNRRASWQPAGTVGHFAKVPVEPPVAARKRLEQLP